MAIGAGQTIGEYEVIRKLGAGGLGVVYEVRHQISQRAEAMKVLHADQMSTPEMAERFRREVQLLASLNHPNIASLHNAFYYENQLIMIMELVHGETLRDRSVRTATSLPKALNYASQMLSALAVAHQSGIVHRDIKPSNVMITDRDVVKLLDFGIAITGHSVELTNPGFLLGSLSYMSPEQVAGGKATAKSDIYSVGVTLYELLTGKLPITGATDFEIMTAHLQRVPTAPIDINGMIPQHISNAIMRALAKDPAHRFETADEFATALQGASAAHRTFTAETNPMLSRRTARIVMGPGMAQPPISSGGAQPPSNPAHLHSLPLEEVTKKLAVYIGPVAKLVVNKIAAECTSVDQLYALAAKQISSEPDRQKFLRSRHT
jgi:serine/threonine protein kinase